MMFLFAIYWANNPVDQSSTAIKWPYVIVESPYLVAQYEGVELSLSVLNDSAELSGTTMKVIDPSGNQYSKVLNRTTSQHALRYPSDFVGASTASNGNYSVLLLGNSSSSILVGSHFNVVYDPSLTLLMQFMFGNGLPITIGLIASLITLLYQVGSQELADRERAAASKNQELARKRNEKAKWMLDNAKNYLLLVQRSEGFLSAYSGTYSNVSVTDVQDLVFHVARFYKAYDLFLDKTAFYYLDDLRTEEFLKQVDAKIFGSYHDMINGYTKLRKFFDKTYDDIIADSDFQKLAANATIWLGQGSNAKDLYALHLVQSWVLNIIVNKALKVSYTDEIKVDEQLCQTAKNVHRELQTALDDVNKKVFSNPQSYYKLYDNQGNLLPS
jgi:hypothetical protein